MQHAAPSVPQNRLLHALARYHRLAHRGQIQGRTNMESHDVRSHSAVTAGLGLFWVALAIGVAVLAGHRPAPEAASPAIEAIASRPALIAEGAIRPVADRVQEQEQRALAEFIAKRWRIADSAAARFVSIAYRAGQQHAVDPVLILAVMAIESRYNPVAESVVGAMGLMQVIPRFHPEKLVDHGGEHALLDPEVNIHVGAQILREYTRRLGDLEAALQMYAGAFDEPTSQYAAKVFAEQARLEPVRQRARRQSGQSA